MIPQITYGSYTYLPVVNYKNLAVDEDSATGKVTVTYDTTKLKRVATYPYYANELDVQAHTVITFTNGSITREDTFTSKTLTGDATATMDFTSFAPLANATEGSDKASLTFNDPDISSYGTTGFDTCALSDFATKTKLSTTPIGQLQTKYSCSTGSFALSSAGKSFSWTVKYKDLP